MFEIFALLWGLIAVLESATKTPRPCFHDDILSYDAEMVYSKLREGCSINGNSIFGFPPLHWAIISKDVMACRMMVSNGADPTSAYLYEESENTFLHMAADLSSLAVVKFFVKFINVNAKNKLGHTPLHLAVSHLADYKIRSREESISIVEFLLAIGAIPYYKDIFGFTPFYLACEDGDSRVIADLLAVGWDVDLQMGDLIHPLRVHTYWKDYSTAVLLVAGGADVETAMIENGVVHLMAREGQVKTLKLFLAAGVDVSALSEYYSIIYLPRYMQGGNDRRNVFFLLMDAGIQLDMINTWEAMGIFHKDLLRVSKTQPFEEYVDEVLELYLGHQDYKEDAFHHLINYQDQQVGLLYAVARKMFAECTTERKWQEFEHIIYVDYFRNNFIAKIYHNFLAKVKTEGTYLDFMPLGVMDDIMLEFHSTVFNEKIDRMAYVYALTTFNFYMQKSKVQLRRTRGRNYT